MAFFLPSSASTSTTASLSSSPLPVIHPLDSDDESERSHDGNESLRHRQSDDISTTQSGFTMFGLLNRRIDYISGASASDISSLEGSSESEGESSWTRRATYGYDDGDGEDRSTRMSRSAREDARSPSRRKRTPDIHDPVYEGTSGSHGVRVHHQTGRTSASEPNIAPSTNQVEGEETVKRRGRRSRHGSTEVDGNTRREVKLRKRRDSHSKFEGFICTFQTSFYTVILALHSNIARDFFLIITLCFGLACAWMVLARPIMMNWFGSRSGDGYIYMDG